MASSTGTRRTVLTPGPFAQQLARYLVELVTSAGGDISGRWLEKRTDQSKTYWAKILKVQQAMTTNDIAIVAEVFGMKPFAFVAAARLWNPDAEGDSNVVFADFGNVPGRTEDERAVARPADPDSGEDSHAP